MEWHHAGMLPKSYGGGMKKTYFLNSEQIVNLANNWQTIYSDFQIKLEQDKSNDEIKKQLENKKQEYLNANAVKVFRDYRPSENFYETNCEMQGKYGWFDYDSKYKLDIYYSGWKFASEEKYNEFLNM